MPSGCQKRMQMACAGPNYWVLYLYLLTAEARNSNNGGADMQMPEMPTIEAHWLFHSIRYSLIRLWPWLLPASPSALANRFKLVLLLLLLLLLLLEIEFGKAFSTLMSGLVFCPHPGVIQVTNEHEADGDYVSLWLWLRLAYVTFASHSIPSFNCHLTAINTKCHLVDRGLLLDMRG